MATKADAAPRGTPDPASGVAQAPAPADTDTGPRLPLPHDRDEAADREGHPPEPVIEQAGKDVARGLQDTDLRGTAADNFDRKFGPRKAHGTP